MQDQTSGQTRYTRNALRYMKFENSLPTKQCFSTDSSYTTMFGAAAYTAQISMQVLWTVFCGQLLYHFAYTTCTVCAPDLAVRAHLVGVCVKTKVCETHSARLVTLSSEFDSVFKGSLKKW